MIIYFSARDMMPLWRVDVSVLFGKYLARKGFEISWFVLSPTGVSYPVWFSPLKSKIFLLTKGPWLSLQKFGLERYRDIYLGYKILTDKPDLAIIRDDYISLLITGFFCWIKKVPCVFWMSFLMEDGFVVLGKHQKNSKGYLKVIYGNIYSLIGRLGLKLWADHLFVQSERMESVVRDRKLFDGHITPVHMAVDLEELSNLPSPSIENHKLNIGYCGAISIHRGIESIFLALELLKNKNHDVCLHLVGWFETKEDEEFFTNLIHRLDVSKLVVFYGRMPWIQGCAHMRACDLCISPIPDSRLFTVGSPTKLFEYMALGKPVIASRHALQSKIVEDAKCGWLCDLTGESVAEAVLSALSSQNSLLALGQNGLAYTKKFHSYSVRSEQVYKALTELRRT